MELLFWWSLALLRERAMRCSSWRLTQVGRRDQKKVAGVWVEAVVVATEVLAGWVAVVWVATSLVLRTSIMWVMSPKRLAGWTAVLGGRMTVLASDGGVESSDTTMGEGRTALVGRGLGGVGGSGERTEGVPSALQVLRNLRHSDVVSAGERGESRGAKVFLRTDA